MLFRRRGRCETGSRNDCRMKRVKPHRPVVIRHPDWSSSSSSLRARARQRRPPWLYGRKSSRVTAAVGAANISAVTALNGRRIERTIARITRVLLVVVISVVVVVVVVVVSRP
uniref:Uncharacterized protein n=1 Tax=Plectus sambesii TaxID=2011161 RepID=A0A914VVH3_9BILA